MADSWFLSCGAGFHQIPLAQAAKSLGFRVAACDRNPEAPLFATGIVDRALPVSLLDAAGLLASILDDNDLRDGLGGIYARSYGKAVEVAHYVARRCSLVSNPHRSLTFFRDKTHYKRSLEQWGIPIPTNAIRPEGPWIVRPAAGHAKEGIRILHHPAERDALPSGSLVEPLIEGRECILLGLIVGRTFYPVIITDRYKHADFTDRMHVYPSDLPPRVKYEMVEHCRRIARRSGLENGPFLAEFLVDQDDHPYLIECAPEVGGEFLADDLVPAMTGLPYFELLVRIYTGMDLDGVHRTLRDHLERSRTQSMVIRYLAPHDNASTVSFSAVLSPSLFRDPGFYFARELSVPHDTSTVRLNRMRPGVFALTGPEGDRDALMERADRLATLENT